MGSGWVKRSRKMKDWEWYKTKDMAHFFMHLVAEANYKDKTWKGIEIKRGSFITSRKALAFETGLSERAVRTCLNRLKTTKEITIKATRLYSVITICNYDTYNNLENGNDQENDQQNDQRSVLKTTNRTTTTKNIQESKKTIDSSINPHSPPRGRRLFNLEDFKAILKTKEIPEDSKLFETLLEFFEHRQGMRAPLTELATNKLLTQLDKLGSSESEKVEMLNESILNNWKGVFQTNKTVKKNKPLKPGQLTSSDAWAVTLEAVRGDKPYLELPEIIKETIKASGGLSAIGESLNINFAQHAFKQTYNELLQKQEG